jgi:hypothetical protein
MMQNRPYPASLSFRNKRARNEDSDDLRKKTEKHPVRYRQPANKQPARTAALQNN